MRVLQSQIKILVLISLNQKTKFCKVCTIMALIATFMSIKHMRKFKAIGNTPPYQCCFGNVYKDFTTKEMI